MCAGVSRHGSLCSASLGADTTSFVNHALQQGVAVSPEVRRATRLRLLIPLRLTAWPGSPAPGVMVLAFSIELRLDSRCLGSHKFFCKKYLTRLRLSNTSKCPSERDSGLGSAVGLTLHTKPHELAEILNSVSAQEMSNANLRPNYAPTRRSSVPNKQTKNLE